MADEVAKLLRLQSNADKEFKITVRNSVGTPTKFTSQLTGGHTRKGLFIYNASDDASGEVVWGGSDCDTAGMPIPQGALVEIPVLDSVAVDAVASTSVDIYLANTVSGEQCNLRILELA
uniref:Uncharacterized protein n=1 Tax=viral metagenome TaxID=1070528 RepID=A0A6M3LQC9_9ZZZZ